MTKNSFPVRLSLRAEVHLKRFDCFKVTAQLSPPGRIESKAIFSAIGIFIAFTFQISPGLPESDEDGIDVFASSAGPKSKAFGRLGAAEDSSSPDLDVVCEFSPLFL